MDKIYLKELEGKGVNIPQTIWINRGEKTDISSILYKQIWDKAVIKPRISASAVQTWTITKTSAKDSQSRLNEILETSHVIVQKFMNEIITDGELSLIFFNKQYSHTVNKSAVNGDFRVQKEFGGTTKLVDVSKQVIEQASKVLNLIDKPLLYSRVDGVVKNNNLIIIEVELIEPYLFLKHDQGSAKRFAISLENFL